tara:strand:- start:311 stop:541 length:231 start_codon:yes stop_codon:yes gene_type:complete
MNTKQEEYVVTFFTLFDKNKDELGWDDDDVNEGIVTTIKSMRSNLLSTLENNDRFTEKEWHEIFDYFIDSLSPVEE